LRFGGRRRGSLPATAPLPWQRRPRPSESGWPDARTSHRRSPTQSHEPERKTDPFNFVCSPPRGRRDQRLGEPARVEMPHGQGGACKRYICRRLPDRRLVRRTSGTRRIPHYTGNAHTLVQGSPHRLPRGRRKRPRRDPRGHRRADGHDEPGLLGARHPVHIYVGAVDDSTWRYNAGASALMKDQNAQDPMNQCNILLNVFFHTPRLRHSSEGEGSTRHRCEGSGAAASCDRSTFLGRAHAQAAE